MVFISLIWCAAIFVGPVIIGHGFRTLELPWSHHSAMDAGRLGEDHCARPRPLRERWIGEEGKTNWRVGSGSIISRRRTSGSSGDRGSVEALQEHRIPAGDK